ncbi:MAG TPA: hypothetical protein VGP68_19765, partial [Gemmataceae bacterium]|nr:hypothetical protein [Gemmataceae bacterium]
DKGVMVTLDGLHSKAPADWVEETPSSQMRVNQFKLPGANGKDSADLGIYYFGGGQGGSADANVKRWRDMFTTADGKKKDEMGKVDTMKIGDVKVTYLDIQGTYLSKVPPFSPNAKTVAKPDHRMLAVVFEGKDGPYFIRVVGPSQTVEHHKKGFDEWLKNFK